MYNRDSAFVNSAERGELFTCEKRAIALSVGKRTSPSPDEKRGCHVKRLNMLAKRSLGRGIFVLAVSGGMAGGEGAVEVAVFW